MRQGVFWFYVFINHQRLCLSVRGAFYGPSIPAQAAFDCPERRQLPAPLGWSDGVEISKAGGGELCLGAGANRSH